MNDTQRLTYLAVETQLRAAIAKRVATERSRASCETSWHLREELKGLGDDERKHRDRAVAGYKSQLVKEQEEEDKWWAALRAAAIGEK